MDLDAVLAVTVVATSKAAAQCLQVEIVFPRCRIDPGEDGCCVCAIGRADNSVGQGVCEGTDYDVDNALAGICTRGDRGRRGAIQKRSGRALNSQTLSTLIVRNFGSSGFQAIGCGRLRCI